MGSLEQRRRDVAEHSGQQARLDPGQPAQHIVEVIGPACGRGTHRIVDRPGE
jgi:hypothetical protein